MTCISKFLAIAVSQLATAVNQLALQEVTTVRHHFLPWPGHNLELMEYFSQNSIFLTHPYLAKLRLFEAIIRRGSEAQLQHLHSVDRLFRGRRSWGLDLDGIDSLLWGPSPWLVSLEKVCPGLNTPQTAPVTDVHLLWSHLLTTGSLEAWATHTGMWPTAGATVLAGGLAVSWRESTDGYQVFSRSC